MRSNQKMYYEEFIKMKNSVAELPFYVIRKVGAEFILYAYHHSSRTNGYIRKNAVYNPQPYKGRFGVGFTVKSNNSTSTRHAYITYYIEIRHSVICSANDNCTLCPLYSKEGNGEECYY